MPQRKKLLWFVLLTWLLLPQATSAQSSYFITINHHVVVPGSETTGLDIFFTLRDGNGRFILQPDIKSATLELLGSDAPPVSVKIDKPATPIFITLLLDTSGSMTGRMDQVRTAAKSAIANAPPNAYFAIIPFNETSTTALNFSNDHRLIEDAIDDLPISNLGTCLYDTAYDAIGLLEQQITSPVDRRAIILFTDGKDQKIQNDPTPCSRHTYRELIDRARPQSGSGLPTPIHTIGLYNESPDELNGGELRNMAAETDAFSAIGSQADLGGLFQEIIDGLNSQLVAHGEVLAQQGENRAALSLELSNDTGSLIESFTFLSTRSDKKPTPALSILINSARYDSDTNRYALSLAIENPADIHQLVVTVWDEANLQVGEPLIMTDPNDIPIISLDGTPFQANAEYVIRIQALDITGNQITNADGEVILAEHSFVHKPASSAPPIQFTIQAVTADFDNGLFYIDLDVPEAERVQSYEGFIRDGESGGKIHEFGPTAFAGSPIRETLPNAIRLATQIKNYPVTVYLTTTDGQRSESSYNEFEPVPPEPPTMWERLGSGLRENPVLLLAIVMIVGSVVGYFYLQNRQKKREEPVLARPPVDKSIIIHGLDRGGLLSKADVASEEQDFLRDVMRERPKVVPPEPPKHSVPLPSVKIDALPPPPPVKTAVRLRLRIIQRDRPPSAEKIITTFPCTIGREDCDLVIENDPRISRPHAQFLQRNNTILVEDLKSLNGTYLDKIKLPANAPTPLGQTRIIRLTSQTSLEVEQI